MKNHASKSIFNWVAAILALGAIAAITLFAYLTARAGWKIYLEIFSHFQAQYFFLSLIPLAVLALLRRKWFFYIGLLLCTLLSLPLLTWYLPPNRLLAFAKPEADLRVLVANINTQNKSYEKVLNLVRAEKPDVAIFMEVDEAWKAQFDTLSDLLPYSAGLPNPYNLGLLVYSNQTLDSAQVEFFGTDNNTSVIAQLAIANQPVTLVATHPLPPAKTSFFHARNRQLDDMSQYLAEVDQPVILAGDLNTTMWSPYYQRFIRKTGLHNTRDGFGILPTWPTQGTFHRIPGWLTPLVRIPIDHCLVSPELTASHIHTGANTGSDHKPLIVDLRISQSS